ncbi:hypothetical protein L0F51_04045 [Afifella sp. H1R]|uniref:hypothetical protein n=1 Tax=Afifella sp. H1R TaxID=2908841 RepID=UPI001F1F63C7|nr:hypothetical protein [Afifella sp. H1R]MCF1502936.1 hypothetical protein [Afifella sp. H1R]
MSGMTKEERIALGERVASLEMAIAKIENARKPFDEAIKVIVNARDEMLEAAGVTEVLGYCETCAVPLFDGDRGFYDSEAGLYWCEDDAPTWGQLREDIEALPDGTTADDGRTKADVLAAIDAHDPAERAVRVL